MNLAEQLKSQIAATNPIDREWLTQAFSKIFLAHPKHWICLNVGNEDKPKLYEKDDHERWSLYVPTAWLVQVAEWAKDNGVDVTPCLQMNGNLEYYKIKFL